MRSVVDGLWGANVPVRLPVSAAMEVDEGRPGSEWDMPAGRVLSSEQAKSAITQMQSILNGGLTNEINDLNTQGTALSDPTMTRPLQIPRISRGHHSTLIQVSDARYC